MAPFSRRALRPVVAALAALGSLAPLSAHAATFVPRTLAQLVQRSDATVLGHPVERRAFWQQGRIITEVTLQLDEVWHGKLAANDTVRVLTLGGSVGDLAQRVDGAAALPAYGRVVVHLQRVAAGYVPTAMAQGVWLVDDLYGSRSSVRHQVPMRLPLAVAQARRSSELPARGPQDLAALRAAVREAALAAP